MPILDVVLEKAQQEPERVDDLFDKLNASMESAGWNEARIPSWSTNANGNRTYPPRLYVVVLQWLYELLNDM